MEEADRRLLIDIHGTVSGIKPVLEANASALKALDERQRRSEIMGAEHGVKIERLGSDLDGLGRKVRAISISPAPAGESTGRWLTFLELIAAMPKIWHALFYVGTAVVAASLLIARLTGHTVTPP